MARFSYWKPSDDWNLNEEDLNNEDMVETFNDWKYDEEDIHASIKWIKNMMKKYGGSGYTLHCDRDGGCFETTNITIKGNNSKHKYNRHL